ncbi:HesA/MoeB/ThiF family protein [Thalassotalea euphylliae]|uniref:HesA/MoeB/ThiF family protein n=1 Tax=Thalassotalea euphylliae TaxID=1655234 RepID=UPI00362FAA71
MLSQQEQLRYGRQIMLSQIGEQGQLALQQSRVLVVGMGGLGCPAAQYLSAAGIGHLLLCDGDSIELTNLQRQILYTPDDIGQNKAETAAIKLAAQNPLVEIEAIDEMFDKDIASAYLGEVDIVIDCTDNIATRYLLNQVCHEHTIPLVVGAATGFDGQTMLVDPSQQSACYQCVFPKAQQAPTENCQTLGILGPVLSIIAGMQSLTAIKYLTNNSTTINQLCLFDGLSQQWQQFTLQKTPDCPVCGSK